MLQTWMKPFQIKTVEQRSAQAHLKFFFNFLSQFLKEIHIQTV